MLQPKADPGSTGVKSGNEPVSNVEEKKEKKKKDKHGRDKDEKKDRDRDDRHKDRDKGDRHKDRDKGDRHKDRDKKEREKDKNKRKGKTSALISKDDYMAESESEGSDHLYAVFVIGGLVIVALIPWAIVCYCKIIKKAASSTKVKHLAEPEADTERKIYRERQPTDTERGKSDFISPAKNFKRAFAQ